jgi:transcriptional regulator with XRE-family HTH domain
LAERVKQLRETRNISPSEAAEKLGCHRSAVWKMENAAHPIPTTFFPKMAELFEVDEADLCSFPALATRYELFEVTRDLPEESLQQLLREARRLAKSAKSGAPSADPTVAWQRVHAQRQNAAAAEKTNRKKVG